MRPRSALAADIVTVPAGQTYEAMAVAYAQRCACDRAEALARGWTTLGTHYATPGGAGVPRGIRPGGGYVDIPDYAVGEDGGYTKTTPTHIAP